MHKIQAFDDCVSELSRLPGIGPKTASRLAMHLLKMKPEDVRRLSEHLIAFKEKTVSCNICGGISENDVCPICRDSYRNTGILCVVEEAKDLFVIEQTGYFKGRYHVLGGKISPLDGVGPDNLRIANLADRIVQENIGEVIIATNPDVDGETTAAYLIRIMKKYPKLKITKLASGIAIGTHIEYADEITVVRALEGRREIC
ncbi:MAG: recombination mediator RecR [Deferribacteraceae bacterium]|jgi:recombination protein RecR|nr:recombination mediator RecR [Deferribacteraceae bacterium]